MDPESDDSVQPFRRRMYEYYHHLTHVQQFNVLPVAVYLRVGLEGRGRDVYRTAVLSRTPLQFEYDNLGLPALPGADYLAQDNILGQALSVLMNWPRQKRTRAAVEALERIVGSAETTRRKMLLCDTVNTYAPLDDAQRVELLDLLCEPERMEVAVTVKTWFEEGLAQGLQSGRRRLLLAQLEERFGPLCDAARQRLDSWPAEQLTAPGRALLHARSLSELGLED